MTVRTDPICDLVFGKDDRHAVMDETDALTGITSEDGENRVRKAQIVLDAVQAGQPADFGAGGLDHEFITGLDLAVRRNEVLPFKIVGSRDDAAMRSPGFPKSRLLGSSLGTGIDKGRGETLDLESPDHGKYDPGT